MAKSRGLWQLMNFSLIVMYLIAAAMLFSGVSVMHPFLLFTGFIVFAHAMEIPLAFVFLADSKPEPLRLVLGTLLFGFTWWLPAKWGVYKPNSQASS